MTECDILVKCLVNAWPDPDRPFVASVVDADGRTHAFRVSPDALTADRRLKARRSGRRRGDPVAVIVFSGDPPHPDGRHEEGRDFWDLLLPKGAVRTVGTDPDPPRPKGRASYLGVVTPKGARP